jgi:hypothetical protein
VALKDGQPGFFIMRGVSKDSEMTTQYDRNPELRTVRAKIQCFLDLVEGNFRTRDAYEAVGAKSTSEKASVRQALHREKEDEIIEPTGTYGVWRKINKDIEWCDLSACQESHVKKLDTKLPTGLGSLISTFQGDLIVIAGVTNTGKSSFALELALQNKDTGVRYFSSELTIEQIQDRATKDGIDIKALSGIKFAMRYEAFQDVVQPDCINIIDYLQAPGSAEDPRYFAIPHLISKIHEKMNGTGLTLICIQKDPGKRTGDGGFKTLYRSNLYLSLDKDDRGRYWVNIQKCKVRSALEGFRMEYKPKLFSLEPISDWIPP